MFAASGIPVLGDAPLGSHDSGLSLDALPSTNCTALPVTLETSHRASTPRHRVGETANLRT